MAEQLLEEIAKKINLTLSYKSHHRLSPETAWHADKNTQRRHYEDRSGLRFKWNQNMILILYISISPPKYIWGVLMILFLLGSAYPQITPKINGSRSNPQVKQHRAQSVIKRGQAWECRILLTTPCKSKYVSVLNKWERVL